MARGVPGGGADSEDAGRSWVSRAGAEVASRRPPGALGVPRPPRVRAQRSLGLSRAPGHFPSPAEPDLRPRWGTPFALQLHAPTVCTEKCGLPKGAPSLFGYGADTRPQRREAKATESTFSLSLHWLPKSWGQARAVVHLAACTPAALSWKVQGAQGRKFTWPPPLPEWISPLAVSALSSFLLVIIVSVNLEQNELGGSLRALCAFPMLCSPPCPGS